MKEKKGFPESAGVLTRQQLADYLGLSLSSVDRLDIPRIKLTARRFCYKKADVDLWLETKKEYKTAGRL